MAADIVYGHHERFDGTGYPIGLAKQEIPLAARITALADVYDALRSKRPYKDPWPHNDAIEEIRRGKGTHFDPLLVDAFLKREKDIFETAEKLKD